jgi:putative endonuclease
MPVVELVETTGLFNFISKFTGVACRNDHNLLGEMKGYMYILLCSNSQYYTGSTNDLNRRIAEHQNGEGANFTKKHLPIKLVYYEEFDRIDDAFYREKQVQGWSRKKKEALINGDSNRLPALSRNYTQYDSSTLRPFDKLKVQLSFDKLRVRLITLISELVESILD